MPSVDSVNNPIKAGFTEDVTHKDSWSNIGLGKDDFLRLLIANIKYQDPLSPMDSDKMLEQFTQLTLIEKIIEVSEKLDDIKKVLESINEAVGGKPTDASSNATVNPTSAYNIYKKTQDISGGAV
ncbi:hypothetical protein GM182_03455 [bacterium 3DAC]|jgi:flagellar basal-body rod modification protein FlgD|nr:hypothetical protein [Dictyoglomota bacterium]UZN22966.1 hypothetical protein GM182_03455 [bacterium 3DAC]